MENFLSFLISPLLTVPQALVFKISAYSVSISVDDSDMGRVIGKNGSIISAVRNLVRTYSITHQLPFTTVVITEPPAKTDLSGPTQSPPQS